MRTIHVFFDGTPYTYKWLKALYCNKSIFKEMGYKVVFPTPFISYIPHTKSADMANLKKAITGSYDVVMLAFHHSNSYLGACRSDERCKIVKEIKKHCNMLVWLDTADSTGTALFDVMPYVDIYMKKQLLKDRQCYLKPIWGGRPHCEYYHDMLKIEDPRLNRRYPILELEFLPKLKLSWNVGYGDIFRSPLKSVLFNRSMGKPAYVDIENTEKSIDIHFRGSGWSPIAGYQRSHMKELVSSINYSHPDMSVKVPHKEYIKEIKNSKIVLSPFGWGEICTRDFEAFAYGCALVKPSMEHCETYPQWYIANETYIPIDWNFDNFENAIQTAMTHNKQLSLNGQNLLKAYTQKEKKYEFVKHIINQLESNS